MTYRIAKAFAFSASHVLRGLPEGHPCSRLHGHNYVVEIEIESSQLDSCGFVIDYRALDPFKQWIDANLDHRHLNDTLRFNPSAELLASYLFELADTMFVGVTAIRVRETDKTVAEVRR